MDINDDYEKTLKQAENLYSTIGRTWCPVLNEYINFNQVGFEHLIRKGMRPRTKNDQIRRLKLLKYAKNIINDDKSILVERDEKNIAEIRARFWAVTQKIEKRIIVIVIRQKKMGQKHFFSIYDQKTTQ